MKMKRITIYILSLVFVTVGITSCGKTTKGKLTNEWKVTSYQDVETSQNTNGDKTISTISITGNTVTNTDVNDPVNGPETTTSTIGTLNTHEFTIKKDGTWSWIIDQTFTDGSSVRNERMEQSGSWSFLNKTKGDDFKKYERVLFNVLAAKLTDIQTENQIVVANNIENLTYTTGKSTMIYTITESKKNKLEMELESKYVFTQDSDSNSSATTRKLVLEKK
jgi:hypothetical protein